MQTFYRHIVAQAWDFSRRHIFLWPLAFFASFVGIAGTFQILFDVTGTNSSTSAAAYLNQTDFITSIFIGWSTSFDQIPWMQLHISQIPLVLFFFFLLFVVLALAIVITSSEGGLIYALAQLQDKKKTGYLVSFRRGLDKFWSLFSINLIYRIIYLIFISVIIIPLIYIALTGAGFVNLLIAVLVYLILVPVLIILDLITRYSLMYIMIYDKTIRESLRNGWLLFATNWIISIETALLIFASLFAAFLVMTIVLIPLVVLFLAMFASMVAFSTAALQIFVATALIILIAIVALFVTLFTTLQMSIWVGVFKKITTGEHLSKIHRIFRHLPWLHKSIV